MSQILFDHMLPPVDQVRLIVDPYDMSFSLVMIVTGLMLCLACLALIIFSEVKKMSDKFVGDWIGRAASVAVWVALVSFGAIYYPALDYWLYGALGGRPFYTGLANYLGYGRLHVVSVVFTMLVIAAAIVSPVIVALMVKLSEKIVTQARGHVAGDVAK